MQELKDVLPSLTYNQVQKLLFEMKKKGMIYCIGKTGGRYGIQGQVKNEHFQKWRNYGVIQVIMINKNDILQ